MMISYVYKGVGTNVWSIVFPGNFSNRRTSSSPGGYPCLQLMPRWQDLPVFLERFVTVWTFYYNIAPRTGDICFGLTKFAVRDTRFICLCRYYEDYF